MRKMMALVLSAAMALSLTACGGQSGEKPADTKAAGSSTAASEAAGSGDSASVDTARCSSSWFSGAVFRRGRFRGRKLLYRRRRCCYGSE